MHMRVLLFRVFFVIPVYSFFKGRLRVGEKILCSLTPFACLSMFRLPKPYCALRSQHLLSQMHSLLLYPNCIRVLFPKKVLLLRFPFHCTFPIPLRLKTKEEPKINQGLLVFSSSLLKYSKIW